LKLKFDHFCLLLIVKIFFSSINLWAQDSTNFNTLTDWRFIKAIDGKFSSSGVFQEAIAIDLDTEGNLYVLDRGRNRLLKYSVNGFFLKEIGGFGDGPEQFDDPRDVDAHLTLNIYVADYNNSRIVRYNSKLDYLSNFRTSPDDPVYFQFPLSVAINGQYDIFLLEDLNRSVMKFDRFNQPLVTFGTSSDNLGQLLGPYQLTSGRKNEIYVTDPLLKSILVFDYLGNFLREIKHPDFIEPKGIAISQRDELVVVDQGAQHVFFFEGGKKFNSKLDLHFLNEDILDVALWNARGSSKRVLYLLSSRVCYIYSKN
jgi:hypothetical protein